jgi:oligopeptide/dipeptide ABC transporter ATP-binding protein
MAESLLRVRGLTKVFAAGAKPVRAVNGVDIDLAPGETLGLVGESGSGKSTIGRCLLRLVEPSDGTIEFDGQDLRALGAEDLRRARARLQMVFQDPWGSLNPRLTAQAAIEEPLMLHSALDGAARRRKVAALAQRVRLTEALLSRYPAELSGGQLQRVCIARAIATDPKLVVLDEPTSSLDVSVRAGILDLLAELKRDLGIAMIFISHDLATVRRVSERVAVLYLGAVVETGSARELFENPRHPYTAALISADLSSDPRQRRARIVLQGEIPSPIDLPPGCFFASRCPVSRADCSVARPPAVRIGAVDVACVRAADGSFPSPTELPR